MISKFIKNHLLLTYLFLFLSLSLSFSTIAGISTIQPDYSWSMDSLFGTQIGNPTVISNGCVKGKCINFDGSSCIGTGNGETSVTNVQNVATYTIWLKTGSDVSSLQYALTQNVDHIISGTTSIRNARGIFVDKGLIGIYTRQGDNKWEQINLVSAEPNSWYFISLVQTKSELTGYINGIKIQSLSFTGSLTSYSNSWQLGCVSTNLINLGFNGILDDINIYSTALNSTDIYSLFTSYSYTPSYSQPYSFASKTQQTQITKSNSLDLNFWLDIGLVGIIILIPIITIYSKRNAQKKAVNRTTLQRNTTASSALFSDHVICVNCQSQLNFDDHFCSECGTPILNVTNK